MRVLVTGGSGSIGSLRSDRLLLEGHDVLCVDEYVSGTRAGIVSFSGNPCFEAARQEAGSSTDIEIDRIPDLACPASPRIEPQVTMLELAQTAFVKAGAWFELVHRPLPIDALRRRQPVRVDRARTRLSGNPKVGLRAEKARPTARFDTALAGRVA